MEKFNDKQLLLIDRIADINDRRTKEQKAISVGYSPKYIFTLQKKVAFKLAVDRLRKEYVALSLPEVYGELFRQVKRGDLKAIELYLRAAGEIQPSTQVNANIIGRDVLTESQKEFNDRLNTALTKRERLIRGIEGD